MLYIHLAWSHLTCHIGSNSSDFNFKLSHVSFEEFGLSTLYSFWRGILMRKSSKLLKGNKIRHELPGQLCALCRNIPSNFGFCWDADSDPTRDSVITRRTDYRRKRGTMEIYRRGEETTKPRRTDCRGDTDNTKTGDTLCLGELTVQ